VSAEGDITDKGKIGSQLKSEENSTQKREKSCVWKTNHDKGGQDGDEGQTKGGGKEKRRGEGFEASDLFDVRRRGETQNLWG